MDRDRDLGAGLFVAYAIGAGIAITRTPLGEPALPIVDSTVLVAGTVFAVASGLVVAVLVGATGVVREVVRSPLETKITIALGGGILAFVAVSTWVAAPFDVRGDRWIASPVGTEETMLLRGVALGLLVLACATLGWLHLRSRRQSRR